MGLPGKPAWAFSWSAHDSQRTSRLGDLHCDCQRHDLGHVFREVIQPESFNRFRFSRYARELSRAVAEMGATSDIHSRLGIDNVRVRFGNNRQFVTMTNSDGSETTAELDMSASDADVARALNIQKINNVTKPSETQMTFSGFQPGSIKAALATAKQKATADLTEAMGILGEAQAKAAEVPAAIKQVAGQMKKEAEDALQEFAEFTNGGPA